MIDLGRFVIPIVLFLGTFAVGTRLGAYDGYTTSAWSVAFAIGLVLFPTGAYFILTGLKLRVQQAASRAWPAVMGHVMPTKNRALIYSGGPWVDFWYVANGRRYEQASIQFAHWSRSSTPYQPGKEIEVRFDPLNPNVAFFAGGDDAVKYYFGAGLIALAAPLVVNLPLAAMAR